MADHDPEHDRLVERLRGFGRQPVDPALQSAHLTAMANARPAGLRPKLRIAAAFLAGLVLGGSGLAAAGALPDGAQDVAHRMFDRVGIQVPEPDRHHGPECGDEVKRNHGQYVRGDRSLAQSRCGKPIGPGGDAVDDGDDGAARGPKAPKGPCQGPPPWASARSMTPAEKAGAQAERRARCGDEGAEPADPEGSTDGAEAQRSATTTTSLVPTTTTTTAPSTTSTTSTTIAADTTTTTADPSG